MIRKLEAERNSKSCVIDFRFEISWKECYFALKLNRNIPTNISFSQSKEKFIENRKQMLNKINETICGIFNNSKLEEHRKLIQIAVEDLDIDRFLKEFDEPCKPCVLVNETKKWNAMN